MRGKIQGIFVCVLLLSCAGCLKKGGYSAGHDVQKERNVTVKDEAFSSVFDEDLDEFRPTQDAQSGWVDQTV